MPQVTQRSTVHVAERRNHLELFWAWCKRNRLFLLAMAVLLLLSSITPVLFTLPLFASIASVISTALIELQIATCLSLVIFAAATAILGVGALNDKKHSQMNKTLFLFLGTGLSILFLFLLFQVFWAPFSVLGTLGAIALISLGSLFNILKPLLEVCLHKRSGSLHDDLNIAPVAATPHTNARQPHLPNFQFKTKEIEQIALLDAATIPSDNFKSASFSQQPFLTKAASSGKNG